MFNVFINNLVEAECTFSKSADVTKLGVAGTPKGHVALQRATNRLENWADRKLMQFNKNKYCRWGGMSQCPCVC